MNLKVTLVLGASIALLGLTAVSAKDKEIIREQQTVQQGQATTTTTTPDSPVIIHDEAGTTIVQPPGSTTVRTQTQPTVVEKKVEIKRKKSPHHLINFWGLKVL